MSALSRDITSADLQRAITTQAYPDLLNQLVELARSTFGFYPASFAYTISYPWMVNRLKTLPAGSHLLDIGAGVSPVPLFLAKHNIHVDCVDSSRHIRTLPPTEGWNEWGFLDYGALHPNLTSYHCDITSFSPKTKFDAIYSIAALAHMPRIVREKTLLLCRNWLQPGGSLFLILDTIPSTDFIWNRSEGVEIEAPIQHGTIDDVANQLRKAGFRIDEFRVMRSIFKSRTDLLFIACAAMSA